MTGELTTKSVAQRVHIQQTMSGSGHGSSGSGKLVVHSTLTQAKSGAISPGNAPCYVSTIAMEEPICIGQGYCSQLIVHEKDTCMHSQPRCQSRVNMYFQPDAEPHAKPKSRGFRLRFVEIMISGSIRRVCTNLYTTYEVMDSLRSYLAHITC